MVVHQTVEYRSRSDNARSLASAALDLLDGGCGLPFSLWEAICGMNDFDWTISVDVESHSGINWIDTIRPK